MGLHRLIATGEGPILNRRIGLSALRYDGTEFPVELTVTQVEGADPPLFSEYLRDITASRQATAELAAGRERLAHVARTLQTSLLPPSLPSIGGFDLAAVYRRTVTAMKSAATFMTSLNWATGNGESHLEISAARVAKLRRSPH